MVKESLEAEWELVNNNILNIKSIEHCDLKVSRTQAKIDENENENEAQLLYSVQLQRPISVYM